MIGWSFKTPCYAEWVSRSLQKKCVDDNAVVQAENFKTKPGSTVQAY